MTASRNNWWHMSQNDSEDFYLTNRENFTYNNYRGAIALNHKFSAKHYPEGRV